MQDQPQIEEKEREVIKQAFDDPLSSIRYLTKNDLYYFIQYFWDEYSNDSFEGNWHIRLLCDELMKVARRVGNYEENEYDLVFNVPPGTTKTAVTSVFFPVWCWVNWYWMKFITTSHSDNLSLESAEYSRDLVRSEAFREIYPEIDIKPDKDNKSNFRVVILGERKPGRAQRMKHGGNRLSTSVKGTVTGYHGHIIIWDDLLDPRKSISEVELKTANDYLDRTLPTRKTNKLVSATIGIMQKLCLGDPTDHLLKNRKDIRHICLPGEIKSQKYYEKLTPKELEKNYVDGLLDVNRLSWKALHKLKQDLGQYGYDAQVGQAPTPPGGGLFKTENIQVIEPLGYNFRANVTQTVRYWDKAGSQDEGAFTVGLLMSRLQNGKYLVRDVVRGQWSVEQRERIIKMKAQEDNANHQVMGGEVIIYHEQEPGSGGKESAQATVKNLAGYTNYPDRPTGDKIYRAGPFAVQVNEGNVMMLRGEWNDAYINELALFSPWADYKDQVDASSGAFNKLALENQAGVW